MKTCGECAFGHAQKGPDGQINFSRRTCYGLPPHVILVPTPQGAQAQGIRSTVDIKDPQCSLFREKISLTGFDAHA